MTGPVVLGLNAAHDASACVLRDGRLVAAITEERLSRVKYHEGFPALALAYTLAAAGVPWPAGVDAVVLNQYAKSDHEVALRAAGYAGPVLVNPSHHLLHAYYAWVASGFRDAALLVVDGAGYSWGEHSRRGGADLGPPPPYSEMEEAESLYRVVGGRLETVSKRWALWEASQPFYRFASLGHMYSMASQYVFGHWKHAGKTMGLAALGDAGAFPEPIVDLSGDEMVIDTDWIHTLPPRSDLPPDRDPVCRDVAAKVQAELERAVLHLARTLHARTGAPALAISGGVGLNSVTNGRLLRESPFSELFVTPAAGDAGVAIGAALYGHHRITGAVPRWDYRDDYHGRPYRPDEVAAALDRYADLVEWDDVGPDAPELAADDLAAGRVVGWFELGSEFGPRSLGHRSILCDPRDPAMRDHLNSRVKFREAFRPYAASVLAERVGDWFDLAVHDPFMLVVLVVRPERAAAVPSVVHADGTCRIQSVAPGHPGMLRAVVEAFDRRTGVPLVLNTSFNIRGEPIVETPEDAIACFLASNIDVLHLPGRRVRKVWARTATAPGELVPVLAPHLTLETRVPTGDGRAGRPEHAVRTRTGHVAPLTAAEHALLARVDRELGVDALGAAAGVAAEEAREAFAGLQDRGLVAFRRPGLT